MSSILGRWLIAGGALLALGLVFLLVIEERGSTARGSARASTVPADAHASSTELAAPGSDVEPGAARAEGVATRAELPAFEDLEAGAPGVYLHLLDRDGKSALAKYPVVLHFSETQNLARHIATMESGASGLLDLTKSFENEAQTATVLVRPNDCRLCFEPSTLRLGELGRTAAQAPALVLTTRPAASLNGLALEETSGEPLAQLALRVVTWSDPAIDTTVPPTRGCFFDDSEPWMVTDEEGRFTAAKPYPAGRLWLETPHGEGAHVVLDAQGTPVEARFRVGPRILLDFRPPGGRATTDFIAGLYRDPAEAGTSEELEDPVSPWTPADWRPRWDNASAVLAGPPPWTRLPAEELEHPLPTFLILFSRDGAAKGVARIDEFERHRREPLFVDVRELGALHGHVRNEDEKMPARDCELALYRPEDPPGEPIGSRWVASPGPFHFQGLEPGPYRLELKADRCAPVALEVSVPSASPIELVLPAERALAGHTIEGEIRTESGLPLDGQAGRASLTSLWAYQPGGEGRGFANVVWSGGLATFRMEDMPPGPYRFYPQFGRGQFALVPESLSAEVPGAALEWLVRDGGEHQRFELWIGATAEVVGEIEVEGHSERYPGLRISQGVGPRPKETLPDGRAAHRIELGPYPTGAFTELVVAGEGLRSRRLTAEDFVVSGEVWRAEVTLVPGWAAQLSLSDEERENVAGVVLALDGVPLPASDESGNVAVELDAKPARLSILTPGWELVEHHSWDDWGTLFPSGEFTLEDGILDVFLRRTR